MADMEKDVEMKLVKFKYSVKKAAQYFSGGDVYHYMPFNLPLENYDEYHKNLFLSVIFDTIFSCPIKGALSGPSINEWDGALELLKDENVPLYRSNDFMTMLPLHYCKGSIIFWALVMTTINEDFYKNEVNMISDLAVMFDFTEDMLKDWIKAVKYLLDGNMFSEDMPLEFKTAEANKFFKHK